jgi:uncharacterized repeat protein (TIGR03837 family)
MAAFHSNIHSRTTAARRWDIFCRVIDNFGDIGVCWRLSADLACRGEQVRLWVDDASALAWMAPPVSRQGSNAACSLALKPDGGVAVLPWPDDTTLLALGDVVIEAFGCELPSAVMQQMKCRKQPPCWINLEYLSAQDYVERCHGLPSPQLSGPAQGLVKHFFYPGFTAKTGGLLREPDLMQRQQRFDANAWRAAQGLPGSAGERWVSLFAYDNPALPALLQALATQPTRLVVLPGPLASKTQQLLADTTSYPHLKIHALPHVTQTEYDHLLWSCDLNFVRGEDSFVRAQWAGRPFVWQIYPQQDGAHRPKLLAFLDQFLATADPALRRWVCSLHQAWNDGLPTAKWPPGSAGLDTAWVQHSLAWIQQLRQQDDLSTQLLRFAENRDTVSRQGSNVG